MTLITTIALFFLVWWMVLFIALPFGLRPSSRKDGLSPVTESGAPRGKRVLIVLLLTTLIATLIVGSLAVAVDLYGVGLDIFPQMLPE